MLGGCLVGGVRHKWGVNALVGACGCAHCFWAAGRNCTPYWSPSAGEMSFLYVTKGQLTLCSRGCFCPRGTHSTAGARSLRIKSGVGSGGQFALSHSCVLLILGSAVAGAVFSPPPF